MAFSFRKMFSNIAYFKRSDEEIESHIIENGPMKRRHDSSTDCEKSQNISFEKTDLDLSSRRYAKTVKKLPETVKHFTAKKCSLSETDLTIDSDFPKRDRNSKKLKLDIDKANRSASDVLNITDDSKYANDIIENTPKQISLGYSGNVFSEKFKEIDFDKSFDLFDYMSEGRPSSSDNHSLRENSDSDVSASEDKVEVKMCKKVDDISRCSSVESFDDVELDRTEDQRITLLLTYQMKLEKMEIMLKNLLTEFQFHIEVSKVFQSKSQMTTLPGADVTKIPKVLGEVAFFDNLSRSDSPIGSWNVVMKREDDLTKSKLKKQLVSMQNCIQEFVDQYLNKDNKKSHFEKDNSRKLRINRRKRDRRIEEFPDLNDILHNLFNVDGEISEITDINDNQCNCCCHKQNDSGMSTKSQENQTITSSIGNFTLDISTLSIFSESLDNLSYNSFDDSSLYSSLLQKSAMDRITFYIQVHSIEIKNDSNDMDFSTKNLIIFYCMSCHHSMTDEKGLLKHVLSQKHAERIHFLYKTKYIRECINNKNEIQPSTILNPMTMYRDLNKIVCFGNSRYACSLCLENNIIGESVLMAHCCQPPHLERKMRLPEILE